MNEIWERETERISERENGRKSEKINYYFVKWFQVEEKIAKFFNRDKSELQK